MRKKVDVYAFEPKENITAYELALILQTVIVPNPGVGNSYKEVAVDRTRELPPFLKRHLRLIQSDREILA